MSDFKFTVETSLREWQRQFANVVRSLAKTITEAATNSDASYKRKFDLADDSGLVSLILSSAKGTRLDTHALKANIPLAQKRIVDVHLYTAGGHERPGRTCDIVDFAEGLSNDEIEKAFQKFAANKTEVSKGRPGRSLFGRGISDVLFGHKKGELYSYKEGILSRAKFQLDQKTQKPEVSGDQIKKPSKAALAEVHLKQGENGTCVRFELSDDCRIPEEGSIVPQLSRFYMLRLMAADPNLELRIIRYRAGKKIFTDVLEYDFPLGDVIARFSTHMEVPDKIVGAAFPDLKIEGIVCRAVSQTPLKGPEARESRENGLLFVDEKDAVLDLTFLPGFEGAPYLARLFGVVRLSGIRQVLEHFLDHGKESPLTTTRDGFDGRHEFTQHLFSHLKTHLAPIYRKEEDKFKEGDEHELSTEATKRLNEAMKQLNKFLNDLMGGGDGDDGKKDLKDVPIQFVPAKTKIVVGMPRYVLLAIRSSDIKIDGSAMVESSNPKVEASPSLVALRKPGTEEKFFLQRVMLKSDILHETATITALADGSSSMLEAKLEVEDVIAATEVEPPVEMEFRPPEAKGQPNRKHTAVLFVNLDAVPIGRKIDVSIVKAQGGISLLDDAGKKVQQIAFKVALDHVTENPKVARVPIPWTGSGWGHFARIMAETKTPAGKLVTAIATLSIDQEEDGGLIKKIDYRDLGNHKCSDLVDGCIYINSAHSLNRAVFGSSKEDYKRNVEESRTAQYRLCSVVTEQGVYRLAEEFHLKNKLLLLPTAPVTSMREFVDDKTNEFAPKLLKILVTVSE